MSKRNRRQREEARRLRELAAQQRPAVAEVQTSAPAPVVVPGTNHQVELETDETPMDVRLPRIVRDVEPARPPRKFAKATFNLDCGVKVTIAGDGDTLETDVWPVFEGNELHIYTGDAALERRMARQQGVSVPAVTSGHTSQISESRSQSVADHVDDNERIRRAIEREGLDPQDEAMKSLGIDFSTMAESIPGVARLKAVPEEVVAP